MLPAILAELPAFLFPPRGRPENAATQRDNDFGPDARVELEQARRQGSDSANHSNPGTGLYGPDGRYIESSARRDLQDHSDQPGERDVAEQTARQNNADRAETTKRQAAATRRHGGGNDDQPRELSLTEFDVALPPAERDELRDLADRIDRRENLQRLEHDDYIRIADLMDRLGRVDEAQRARIKADKLNDSGHHADEAGHDKQTVGLAGVES